MWVRKLIIIQSELEALLRNRAGYLRTWQRAEITPMFSLSSPGRFTRRKELPATKSFREQTTGEGPPTAACRAICNCMCETRTVVKLADQHTMPVNCWDSLIENSTGWRQWEQGRGKHRDRWEGAQTGLGKWEGDKRWTDGPGERTAYSGVSRGVITVARKCRGQLLHRLTRRIVYVAVLSGRPAASSVLCCGESDVKLGSSSSSSSWWQAL